MKTLTPSQVAAALETLISEKEKLAAMLGQPFAGILLRDASAELDKRLGADCVVNRPTALQWSRADFNSVVNNRFVRGTGAILVMGLVIVLLVLSIFTRTFPVIPVWLYMVLVILFAGAFVLIFGKKRKEARRVFFEDMQAHGYNFPWLSQEMNKGK